MSYQSKIKSQEDLKKAVKKHQKEGKVVVQCHGCFDIIHPGHIRYLEHAKALGDYLVVSITADKFILKGDDRPYMPEELRVNSMAALEIVDYVYLDNESWAGPILKAIQPDIYVKGKEYENVYSGVFGDERKIVEDYGGKVYFSSGDVVFSSSRLIEDFKNKFSLDYEVFSIYCKRNNITYDTLHQIINQFESKKIVVIGEVTLDEYQFAEVLDVSGEAPILTIRPIKAEKYVGAAGVIARHIRNLGGTPQLYSIIGNDDDGKYISENLEKEGIGHEFVKQPKNNTIKKVRFLGDNQKLLKIDYSKNVFLESEEETTIIESIKQAHQDASCIVFADFAYGFITNRIREEIIQWANKNDIPVIADVSSTLGGNIAKYKEVYLITPTEREVRMVFDDKTSGLSHLAYKMLSKTNSQNIIITLGANGALAFKNEKFKVYGKPEEHLEQEYLPAIEKKAIDPVGAGDAMLSIISLALSSGASLAESLYLGNIASSLEVNHLGNVPIKKDEVLVFLQQRAELFSHEQV